MTGTRQHHRRVRHTPQPTCRRWPSPTNTALTAPPLEISHVCRLRRKLADAGAGELVENLWGVGFRLVTTA